MKKTIRVALSAILVTVLVTACILPMTALEIRRWYGDIDNNGDVDIADARAALIAAVGIGAELEDMDFVAADVNFDDIITTDDACIILKMAAGIADKTYIEDYEFDECADLFTKQINDLRKSKASDMGIVLLNDRLSDAAREAAEEFVTKTGTAFSRSDDSLYYKVLDKYNIGYTRADKIIIRSTSSYSKAYSDAVASVQSVKALCNPYFDHVGIGAFSKDGRTFYWCILLIES